MEGREISELCSSMFSCEWNDFWGDVISDRTATGLGARGAGSWDLVLGGCAAATCREMCNRTRRREWESLIRLEPDVGMEDCGTVR